MATPAQINANRLNSEHSTGPRTGAGKDISRFNSLRTGVEAKSLVIPGEDPARLETLTTQYHQRFQPADALECYLVDTLVRADWDGRRYARIEAEFLQMDLTEHRRHAAVQAPAFETRAVQIIYRRISAAQRSYFRALKELDRVQAQRIDAEIAAAEFAAMVNQPLQPRPAAPAPTTMESTQIGFVVRRLETGMKLRMKESDRKGVANHPDPEHVRAAGNPALEALVSGHM